MKDVEIIGMLKTFVNETLVGMGALKGAPCTVQGVADQGDGTQVLTLKWTDTDGVSHTTDISLPSAVFEFTNPTNGQTIRYNATSGKWENSNVSFSADLGDLDDVVITSVQDGQVLTYDASNNRWINADGSTVASMSDLTDVTITTVQNGQILTYDSTNQKWVNVTLDIDDLGNVSISSASDGQILTYNATSGKWENKTLELDAGGIGYDNTTSGLSATDTQAAIDELADDKVDKVTGKGLSTNDYTNEAKAIVDGATDELDKKVDKVTGKGLSTNDFTTELKDKLDGIEDNAEVNDIEVVKVNGTALTPDANKAVNVLLSMDKLSDVDLTSIADGYILIYDATNNKWIVGANSGAAYTAGEGIEIDQNNKISSKIVLFTGTEAQWNALPLADKIKFTHYATNDDQTGQIDSVPTQNSLNLMTSGGIWTAIQGLIAKVTGATANNFAALDASGNVIDSGKAESDFAKLTGGNTITGRQVNQANEIVIQCTNLDKDTPPAQSTDGNAYIPFADKDGDAFAVIFANEKTNGAIDLRLDTFGQNNPNGTVMINGLDVPTLLSKIGGNNLHSWLDIPANGSTSGKMTRIFTYDDNLFIGSQVWNNGSLTKEGFIFFQPAPSQITLLNGVTSSEPGNCNILDFGCFCMVNLAGVVIPSGWTGGTPICEIPRTAIARFNFRVPTSTAGGEIIYIDANSKSLRLTGTCDVPIYTNIMIPTFNS